MYYCQADGCNYKANKLYNYDFCGHHKDQYYLNKAVAARIKAAEEQEKAKKEREANQKILEEINAKLNQQETRFNSVKQENTQKFADINQRIDTVQITVKKEGEEARRILGQINNKFDAFDTRMSSMETNVKGILTISKQNFEEKRLLKRFLDENDMWQRCNERALNRRKESRELVLWEKRRH